MRSTLLALAFLLAGLAPSLTAQVTVKRGAVVYHGSASNTTAPAVVDEEKVRQATPEWQKIEDENIDPDSAQGKQLIVKMNKRVRDAIKSVASAESRDMVTRKDDIADPQGRDVADLTDAVVKKIKE